MSEKPVILIADDDPDLRSLVRLHVELLDCEVLEANDGAVALETILVEQPDLVILDVMMPELTGWEILRYIRSKEAIADMKVLMLTGIGETLNELSSPIYGADDYLDKPFKGEVLLDKVRKLLGLAG
ncbi:MAG: response regulator [Proteobacteria bacterium]|nr:response regulator [Pseudomonadota bacterium]